MTCIILNSFILALKWYGQDIDLVFGLDIVNTIFTAIFCLEAAIKITAYKC